MPWLKFKQAFTFKPKPTVTIDYAAGKVANVTQACAEKALAAGAAVETTADKAKGQSDGIPESKG